MNKLTSVEVTKEDFSEALLCEIRLEIPLTLKELKFQWWKFKQRWVANPYWLGRIRWNKWNYKHNIRGLYRWKWWEIMLPWRMPNVKR
jgi:hypothetical protein